MAVDEAVLCRSFCLTSNLRAGCHGVLSELFLSHKEVIQVFRFILGFVVGACLIESVSMQTLPCCPLPCVDKRRTHAQTTTDIQRVSMSATRWGVYGRRRAINRKQSAPTNKQSRHINTSSQIKRSVSLHTRWRWKCGRARSYNTWRFPSSLLTELHVNMKFKRSTSLAGYWQLKISAAQRAALDVDTASQRIQVSTTNCVDT